MIHLSNAKNKYVLSLKDVFANYFKCRKNKRNTINAIKFESDYENNCLELWKEINEYKYEIGKSITFIITRPKIREVFAADFRDRIVHHIVMSRLEPLFEKVFICDNYNCRKNKGTFYGVKRLYNSIKINSKYFKDECYVGKFDIEGFFMSIHKPTLWKKLKEFIKLNYFGKDKKLILWLTKKIVLHNPEKNCIRKSPLEMWDKIAKSKSLFFIGDDYGLPIGNLTSQMFANFYLHEFDIMMSKKFIGYGRYVDDFFVLSKTKEQIFNNIENIRLYLSNNLSLKLHKKKLYVQSYKKGCKFIGSVVKYNRLYVGNYTVGRFFDRINYFNKLVNSYDKYNINNAEYFVSCINSYLGMIKHYKSFKLRKKLINRIDKKWFEVCIVGDSYEKIICLNKFKHKNILKERIIKK